MHTSTIEHQENCLECVERAKEEYETTCNHCGQVALNHYIPEAGICVGCYNEQIYQKEEQREELIWNS